jgi:diaminopimelate epimerase
MGEPLRFSIFDASGNIALLLDARTRVNGDLQVVLDQTRHLSYPAKVEMFCAVTSEEKRLRAHFVNPDGTSEGMCGNAMRSIPSALSLWSAGQTITEVEVATDFCTAVAFAKSDGTTAVQLPTACIVVSRVDELTVLVDVGTPHRVKCVVNIDSPCVETEGIASSTSREPVNATFVSFRSDRIRVRTFERGVGETRSCGTGAISAVMALRHFSNREHLSETFAVDFGSGERLFVECRPSDAQVSVGGSCQELLSGLIIPIKEDCKWYPS